MMLKAECTLGTQSCWQHPPRCALDCRPRLTLLVILAKRARAISGCAEAASRRSPEIVVAARWLPALLSGGETARVCHDRRRLRGSCVVVTLGRVARGAHTKVQIVRAEPSRAPKPSERQCFGLQQGAHGARTLRGGRGPRREPVQLLPCGCSSPDGLYAHDIA